MSVITIERLREFLKIEKEYNNPFNSDEKKDLNKIKFIEILLYRFFNIKDFYNVSATNAILLANFLCNIFNTAKDSLFKIGASEEQHMKKSIFDDYDREEDEKYGIKKDEEKLYYSNLNKYIIYIERYCRQKKIDINRRIDFVVEDIENEFEFDEEHKDDYKNI